MAVEEEGRGRKDPEDSTAYKVTFRIAEMGAILGLVILASWIPVPFIRDWFQSPVGDLTVVELILILLITLRVMRK